MSEDEIHSDGPGAELAPDPRGDLLFMGIAAAVLVVILIFNVLNVLDEWARGGHGLPFWKPAVWEASSGLVFLALAPLMLALTRRAWLLTPPRLPKLAVHLAGAVAVSFVHVVAAGVMRWAAYAAVGDHYNPFAPLEDWPYELRKDLLVYAGIVAIYVAWRRLRAGPPAVAESGGPEVLEVRDGARRHFVPLTEVIWVEAAGNYVELHRGAGGLLHRASLSEMERRLQTAGFVRIHRSRLVRRAAVANVESRPTGDFVVRLRDGRELAGSRRYRRPLLAD
ncbi:MAG: LytTR family DNA-binding domain-containing protein [Caulobacterales bacterium]